MIRTAAVLLVLWAGSALCAESPHAYEKPRRAAYLASALEAIRQAPPQLLSQAAEFASAMERGACSASALRLKVECLMTAARRFCKGREPGCPALMDVVVSNVLAEIHFVPLDRRYEIMREHRDWRAVVAREIQGIRGALAVDFRLRRGVVDDAALPAQIDAYCVSAADKSNLSWQACASSLVWFIGTSK